MWLKPICNYPFPHWLKPVAIHKAIDIHFDFMFPKYRMFIDISIGNHELPPALAGGAGKYIP